MDHTNNDPSKMEKSRKIRYTCYRNKVGKEQNGFWKGWACSVGCFTLKILIERHRKCWNPYTLYRFKKKNPLTESAEENC